MIFRRVTEHLVGSAAAAIDRAVTRAVDSRSRRGGGSRLSVSHESRVAFLERLIAEYPAAASLEFFGAAPQIEPIQRGVRDEGAVKVIDLTWSSAYVPYLASYGERYLRVAENGYAIARLFVRQRPRPMVVVIHGYMSGHLAIEERLWPLAELDALGYDVALFVLPFHGLRGPASGGRIPAFPGTDPRMTNEGFRQAMRDLRGLVAWLRARGHAKLGLLGMSLGGYTAALAGTLESELDFLVPVIPLASIADFARELGSLSARAEHAAKEHALLERVLSVVSPIALPPRISPERVLVVGARADRVTPIAHARRLANHFGAPLVAWHGGHLLQAGRRRSFERVFELLARVRDA